MELLLKTYFYMGIINVALLLLVISNTKYPRVVNFSIGADIVKLFLNTGFLIWVTIILYFN